MNDVPPEILYFCDNYPYGVERDTLRYLDCVYMNMGLYGNDPKQLQEMRQEIIPVFD